MIRIVEPERAVAITAPFGQKNVLGIYIQVPFCQTKCTYCNFHTGVAARSAYAPYALAVEREIREWRSLHADAGLAHLDAIEQPSSGVVEREKASSRESHGHQELSRVNKSTALFAPKIDTVYLGGGTPSLFDPADLSRILGAVRSQFACSDGEVTLEADPETITPGKAAQWLEAGINRISLGAQSFSDPELGAAGRMHRREDIFHAIAHLRSAGLANVSLDLIAGLPHQTPSSWQASIEQTLHLRPEHISIYLLEVDEGSRLGRELLAGGARYGAAQVPGDDAMADSYELACEQLRQAGYEHYEISNWALPGFRSRHNLKYWRREPYLGFGAGAHSFDGQWRWANAHDPAAYATAIERNRLPIEQLEQVTPRQAFDEELFLGLRQLEGIDLARLETQYGAQYNRTLGARMDELSAQGLIERAGTRVRLAPDRLAVSNEVFVALLDEA